MAHDIRYTLDSLVGHGPLPAAILGDFFCDHKFGRSDSTQNFGSTGSIYDRHPNDYLRFCGNFPSGSALREGVGGPGMCVLTAVMVLAVLISPTMILFFTGSLMGVDASYVQAAKALGANRVQRLIYVMVPRATGGMAAGNILALGRALGDTLIALMLAGNAIQAPQALLEPARTLTAHIALVKAADFDSLEFRSIFACGIVLYLFASTATLAVRLILRKREMPA